MWVNKLFPVAILATVLSGCAGLMGGPSGENIKTAIVKRTPEVALQQIKLEDYGNGDAALFYLEKGMLHRMAGQHEASNQAFEAAKEKMEELYTESVSQAAGSMLTSDNAFDYEGETYEQILAHTNQLLNYLEMDNAENAAVIARQLDTKLSALQEEKPKEEGEEDEQASEKIYRCDPYAYYLSGIAFEGVNDWNAARVSYERAYNCYKSKLLPLGVPRQVKAALLRSARQSGARQIYKRYQTEFTDLKLSAKNGDEVELLFVLDEGFVVEKREYSFSATITTTSGIEHVKLALPEYPEDNIHLVKQVRLIIGEQVITAEPIYDVDTIARATLEENLPGIKARALARAATKAAAANKAGDELGFFGKLTAQITGSVLEKADLRAWKSLPHTVWMGRSWLAPGNYDVQVELIGDGDNVLARKEYKQIKLEKGARKNLYLRWGMTLPGTQPKQRSTVIIL